MREIFAELDRQFDMPGHYLPDEAGGIRAAGPMEWAAYITDRRIDRSVGNTYLLGVRVSTVFYGEDLWVEMHGGRPLVYETKIFGGYLDRRIFSTATIADAKKAHELAVYLVVHAERPMRKKIARYARATR